MRCAALVGEQWRKEKDRQSEEHQRVPVVVAASPAVPDAEQEGHHQNRAEQRQRRHVVARVRIPCEEKHAERLQDVDRIAVRRHRSAVEDRHERGAAEVRGEVGDGRVHHRRDDDRECDARPDERRDERPEALSVARPHPDEPENRQQRQQLQRLIRPEPQRHGNPGDGATCARGPVAPAQQRRQSGGADQDGQDVPEPVARDRDHPERSGGPRHRHERRCHGRNGEPPRTWR